MSWTKTIEEKSLLIEEGTYDASLMRVTETESKFGTMTRLDFIISSNDEFDGREVHGVSSTQINEKTKLGKWITAIIGRKLVPGENVTEDDIINKSCRIVIRHCTKDNDSVYANVVDVLPVIVNKNEESDVPF